MQEISVLLLQLLRSLRLFKNLKKIFLNGPKKEIMNPSDKKECKKKSMPSTAAV